MTPRTELLMKRAEAKDTLAKFLMDRGKFDDAAELFVSAEKSREEAVKSEQFRDDTP